MTKTPLRMPATLQERARALAYGRSADWAPKVPRDAATVVLLRDGDAGVEAFVMRRVRTMAFAAGMHVFPGGAVEPADRELADIGDLRAAEAREDAAAIRIAAARETFEETGLLLAVDTQGRMPLDIGSDWWEERRQALISGSETWRDVLECAGLTVAIDRMAYVAHWVTPEVEERRYDTRFFAIAVPDGQLPRHVGGEAADAFWVRPAKAAAACAKGRMPMLPPTVAVLLRFADAIEAAGSAAEAIAEVARDQVVPLLPRPTAIGGGEISWALVNARTGEVVTAAADAPAGSETRGVNL